MDGIRLKGVKPIPVMSVCPEGNGKGKGKSDGAVSVNVS